MEYICSLVPDQIQILNIIVLRNHAEYEYWIHTPLTTPLPHRVCVHTYAGTWGYVGQGTKIRTYIKIVLPNTNIGYNCS